MFPIVLIVGRPAEYLMSSGRLPRSQREDGGDSRVKKRATRRHAARHKLSIRLLTVRVAHAVALVLEGLAVRLEPGLPAVVLAVVFG